MMRVTEYLDRLLYFPLNQICNMLFSLYLLKFGLLSLHWEITLKLSNNIDKYIYFSAVYVVGIYNRNKFTLCISIRK